MTILGNAPREPISAARNGTSGASSALQTALIVYGLQRAGVSEDPELTLAAAAGVAAVWNFATGAAAKIARDEMHAAEAGKVYHGPVKRFVLMAFSALG